MSTWRCSVSSLETVMQAADCSKWLAIIGETLLSSCSTGTWNQQSSSHCTFVDAVNLRRLFQVCRGRWSRLEQHTSRPTRPSWKLLFDLHAANVDLQELGWCDDIGMPQTLFKQQCFALTEVRQTLATSASAESQ